MTEVFLKRISGYKFEARNSAGNTAILDGPKSIGGTEEGLRPMETVLVGLAGCSSFDVLSILKKQRQECQDLDVSVKAERSDNVPSVFTKIEITFEATGDVDPKKLEKACSLSMEKYCSVAAMLHPTVNISFKSFVK